MKYINNFIEYKESKGEKAIYRVHDNTGNTYYSGDYVKWLEEQLAIQRVSKCAHDFIDIDYKIKQCVKCKEHLDLLD